MQATSRSSADTLMSTLDSNQNNNAFDALLGEIESGLLPTGAHVKNEILSMPTDQAITAMTHLQTFLTDE